MIKLYLTCNWDSNQNITKHWESKLDLDNYPSLTLTNIRNDADYFIVFNKPNFAENDFNFMNKNTILIRMEPFMEINTNIWGDWAKPDYSLFKSVISPPENLNFIEWHLNKSYNELFNTQFSDKTKGDRISIIISDKYQDEGQRKRIDFIKYLQQNHSKDIQLDIYGKGNLNRWGIKNHLGELPLYCKDDGVIPYKYHFNCENSFSINYITEKLYDGILSNTLTFYCGAFNVNSLFPNGGFIAIDLDDFKASAQIIINAVKSNLYEIESDKIQQLKLNILKKCTFSKRIFDIIFNDIHQVYTYSWEEIQPHFDDIVKSRGSTAHTCVVDKTCIEEVSDQIDIADMSNQIDTCNTDNQFDMLNQIDVSDISKQLVKLINSIDKLTDAITTVKCLAERPP